MSFNWPDIPFSGTEVDAFVVEYKALAQAIYDEYENYNVNLNKVKLPFRHGEDVRIFLEHGLEYAAFIVKQRSGNSGPGGNFDLSGSPLTKTNLPPTPPNTGPSADPGAMEECFQNNMNGNTSPGSPNEDPDNGTPNPNQPPPVDETGDNSQNNPPPGENPPPPCPPFFAGYQETEAAQTGDCLAIVLSTFFSGFANIFTGGRITYLIKLTFKLVERYIKAIGGTYTLSNLHTEINSSAGVWMREDIISALNKQKYPLAADLSATDKANYGMDPNGNAYVLDGSIAPGFKNSLGSFTVITDGTEDTLTFPPGTPGALEGRTVLLETGLTSISQIKQVRDDYGFNDYGFTNTRSYGNGDMPGDPIPDDQVRSGTEFPDDNTSPCEAASYTDQRGNSGDPKWNYFDPAAYIRYIIAANHGIGKVEPGLYVPAECRGRPFAIHFDWR